ncbi:MAG: (2Fe-2S)-binding protein [Betaproteobacteria bacterium]|nr:(2Fe-2S)-binding protein [Betaproteobacteria bacterium]
MYVCLCRGVTDKQVRDCAQCGVRTLGELKECLGVASQCGKCAHFAKEILKEAAAPGNHCLQPAT